MIQVGEPCPDFSLQDQNGKLHSLSSLKGRKFVLYVYPKGDTPGCTIQGKGFSAAKDKFEAAGITVFGLSADSVASHRDFCNKFSLTHILLADPDETLLSALGVRKSEWKGNFYWERTTFLVDTSGKIAKVYENVDPKGHEEAILQDFQGL